jgi:hypothetical protein
MQFFLFLNDVKNANYFFWDTPFKGQLIIYFHCSFPKDFYIQVTYKYTYFQEVPVK